MIISLNILTGSSIGVCLLIGYLIEYDVMATFTS